MIFKNMITILSQYLINDISLHYKLYFLQPPPRHTNIHLIRAFPISCLSFFEVFPVKREIWFYLNISTDSTVTVFDLRGSKNGNLNTLTFFNEENKRKRKKRDISCLKGSSLRKKV